MFVKAEKKDDWKEFDEPRLHIEKLMSTKLTEFDLSIRILLPLEDAGIRTLGNLTSKTRREISKIWMIGAAGMEVLDKLLFRLGLSFSY